jgi:hypothetical protein
VAIPQDIIYQVISEVGDDQGLLKQCALVSSSFLLPSRKQLFSQIYLNTEGAAQRLHQCLIKNPIIQSFVKHIAMIQPWTSEESNRLFNSPSLPAILQLPFCCLEILSISSVYYDCVDWNDLSSELKDALSNIIHSSTLETLSLTKVINVPITLFLGISHLTTLELRSISPANFDGTQSSSLTQTEATAASNMVVDQCVWHLRKRVDGTRFPSTSAYFSLTQDMEAPTEPIFLPFMCHLRYFEININLGSANLDDFNILFDTFTLHRPHVSCYTRTAQTQYLVSWP